MRWRRLLVLGGVAAMVAAYRKRQLDAADVAHPPPPMKPVGAPGGRRA